MLATLDNLPIPTRATTPDDAARDVAQYGNRGDVIAVYCNGRLNQYLITRNAVERIQ